MLTRVCKLQHTLSFSDLLVYVCYLLLQSGHLQKNESQIMQFKRFVNWQTVASVAKMIVEGQLC